MNQFWIKNGSIFKVKYLKNKELYFTKISLNDNSNEKKGKVKLHFHS